MRSKDAPSLLPLFLVLFIDTLGTAFIIPLFIPLFIDPSTNIVSADTSVQTRNFLYGLSLGIYSIGTFLGAPLLGDLSDRLGRKSILLICLVGAFIGYLLTALAIIYHSIILILLGRAIGGFTAGSMSTAQAAIVDMSTTSNKTKNIGYILLAVSLGFMLGPLISGTLSNPRWSTWFQLTTPLYFAAILSCLNILYLYFCFQETFNPSAKKTITLLSGLSVFVSAFKISSLRILTLAFLFLQLGWSTYIQFIGLFLSSRYHFSPNKIGVFLGCVGAGFTLALCYLLGVVTRYFSLKTLALGTIGLMSLFMLAIIAINNEISAWVLSVPAAIGLSIAYSVLVSLFSDEVSKDKQGWVMGLTGAIGAFSFGLTGIVAGIIVDYGATIPIWFAFVCLALSASTIYFFHPKV